MNLWLLHSNAIQLNNLENHTFFQYFKPNQQMAKIAKSIKIFMTEYESMPDKHFDLPIMMHIPKFVLLSQTENKSKSTDFKSTPKPTMDYIFNARV